MYASVIMLFATEFDSRQSLSIFQTPDLYYGTAAQLLSLLLGGATAGRQRVPVDVEVQEEGEVASVESQRGEHVGPRVVDGAEVSAEVEVRPAAGRGPLAIFWPCPCWLFEL